MSGDELKWRKCDLSRDSDDCKQSPQELPELLGIGTNKFRVTATSANWNVTYLECRVAFAILGTEECGLYLHRSAADDRLGLLVAERQGVASQVAAQQR